MLGVDGDGADGEETIARVEEFVWRAVVKTGGIGDGDESAGGERVVQAAGDGDCVVGGNPDATDFLHWAAGFDVAGASGGVGLFVDQRFVSAGGSWIESFGRGFG